MSSASAVMAFSPPESSKTFCRRLPGGEATTSMPASPELSGSVKRISAMPPPKMAWNAVEKLALMALKACSNFSLEIRSSSAMACWVSAMDCNKSSRSRVRKVKRCSHSLNSSSAIMLTAPMESMRCFISR